MIIPKNTKINKISGKKVLKLSGIPDELPCMKLKTALKLKKVIIASNPDPVNWTVIIGTKIVRNIPINARNFRPKVTNPLVVNSFKLKNIDIIIHNPVNN